MIQWNEKGTLVEVSGLVMLRVVHEYNSNLLKFIVIPQEIFNQK